MIILNVRDIVRQFDQQPVLDGVSFEVRKGERIGLVGPNGAGKSTLLSILTGTDEADSGQVDLTTGHRIAILEQEARFEENETLASVARQGLADLYRLQTEAEETAQLIAAERDPVQRERWQKRYDTVQHELQHRDAYNIDHRVDAVLQGLGFEKEQYDRNIHTFSGGQQNRALLARLLLAQPDLMLLDEPTNHLDIESTEWLENYLAASQQAMILVSHDRFFLDRVTTRILELYQGTIADYPGNFSAYWKQKEERLKVQLRTFEKQQEYIAKTEEFIRKNHYSNAIQAADREKKLERLERVERPHDIPVPKMAFGEPRRAGDWVLDADKLTKGFGGPPLFTDVSVRVLRGERLGIFGANGTGKSTFLKCLVGDLSADSGTVRMGTNVDLAYYDQQLESVDPQLDLVEAVRPPRRPDLTPGALRDMLAKFGLRGEIVFQRVASLSGGEKSKVALTRLAAMDANVLILDEPTNHLDLWARAALEQALCQWPGTVVFVSHDRYFLDQVATTLVALQPGKWEQYFGTYTGYVDMIARRKAATAEAAAASPSNRNTAASEPPRSSSTDKPKRKRRFPYRKIPDLERDIAELEARLVTLQADLGNPDVLRDGQRIKQTHAEFESAQARLSELFEHWEEAVELN